MKNNNTISNEIYDILDFILFNKEDGISYCVIKNNAGKEWIFNATSWKSLLLGLNIYEPISINGKLLKKILPFTHTLLEKRNLLMIQRRRYVVETTLQNICKQLFNWQYDYFFNFFLGTPSVHKKVVIQVDNGKKVIGYIKFSNNEAVIKAFEYEYKYLCWLKTRGIKNVPEPLMTGWFDKNSTIGFFVQSCQKKKGCYTQLKLNKSILIFLKDIETKTKHFIQFENSDYYAVVNTLKTNIVYYPGDKERLLKLSEKILCRYRGKKVGYSAYHGDFTPWNSFFDKKGECYAFDFEYALRSCPPMLDAFHWIISVSLFKKHYNAKKIVKELRRYKVLLKKYILNIEECFSLYLLYYVTFYLKRDGRDLAGKNLENVMICSKLLEYYSIQAKKT